MDSDPATYTHILIELNKAVKMHNFYPAGHPQLDTALEKCYLLFKKALDEKEEIRWRADRKGFYLDKVPLGAGNRDLSALASRVFFRRITELAFNRRLTQNNLRVLLSVIKLEPEEVQAKGGAEAIFAENDVTGILINKLQLGDLKKLKKEIEEKRKKEEEARAAEPGKEAEDESPPEQESGEEQEKARPEKESAEQDEALLSLVRRLRSETDALKYTDITMRIKDKVSALLAEEKFDALMPALFTFHKHALEPSGLDDTLRETARDGLESCMNTDLLRYLVGRVGDKDEPERKGVRQLLIFAGDEAASLLLDAVIDAPDAVTRRNYYNTVLLFGERIRELVEKRLDEGEWFLTRQMVSILGDLGDERSLDALEATFAHEDARVRKEVLKSLVKIRTPRSRGMLMAALDEKDESLVNQAIISLGMLKDTSAIDALARFATKREAFTDTQDTKKEAIRALGNIGDPRAVPILASIISKTVWFGKRANEEVRALAAASLGMIGGPEAYDALEKACEGAAGELLTVCRRILDGRERER